MVVKKQKEDYDSPWKEIIEELFEQFMEFFFPKIYKNIDFSKGYKIKSKEIQEISYGL